MTSGTDKPDHYACGNIPTAGDLVEFGTRRTRMIVSRVMNYNDHDKLLCGDTEFSPNLSRLVARHGQPDPNAI